MKFSQAIFLSLSVAFFIIAVHQTFILGIAQSYWLYMLSVTMLLINKLVSKGQEAKSVKPAQEQGLKPIKKKNTTTTKLKTRR